MSTKKILSAAASIIKLFIILILFNSNSNSNSRAEENNIKYYSDDMGTLVLMYHRFNEHKYPSTNIQMNVFEQQIEIIKDNKLKICIVSPELLGRGNEIKSYIDNIQNKGFKIDAVCSKINNYISWNNLIQ